MLVAEEDPELRLAIDRQLEALGWDVVTVNTGEEAIRVVELGMAVDVLLICVRLPDLDGRAVASTIASLLPRVRVAFMDDRERIEPMARGDAPFLLKPFVTSALADVLVRAIRLPR